MHMETIICDITAFDYWRIPPIVGMLVCGGNDRLLNSVGLCPEALDAFRMRLASELGLCRRFALPAPAASHMGRTAKDLQGVLLALAPNHSDAVDVLVAERRHCHASSLIRTRLCTCELPPGATIPLNDDVSVVTPGFALMQLASRLPLSHIVMLGMELCGSFAVYRPPEPLEAMLQSLACGRGIPKVGGWRPFVDVHGRLTGLWSRPPLVSLKDLRKLCRAASPKRGGAKLSAALEYIQPGAASPFEARAGILLGFPRSLGGAGFAGYEFNKRVRLSRDARLLCARDTCYCDLYWREGLDLECQSAAAHGDGDAFLSDSDRTAALRAMGIDVLPVTYAQLSDLDRFTALCKTLARLRGVRYRALSDAGLDRAEKLRSEVLSDWGRLHRG